MFRCLVSIVSTGVGACQTARRTLASDQGLRLIILIDPVASLQLVITACLTNKSDETATKTTEEGTRYLEGLIKPPGRNTLFVVSSYSSLWLQAHYYSIYILVDEPRSCLRMRCECDKALAEKLHFYERLGD